MGSSEVCPRPSIQYRLQVACCLTLPLVLQLGMAVEAKALDDDPIWVYPHISADGYRTARYRAPTPDQVPEGTTVDTDFAHALWKEGRVRFVDVMPTLEREGPDGTPEWIVLEERQHLPGSVWLPNVGAGRLDASMQGWFARELEAITEGNRDTPLLFYCITDCWMAWNAVRRAAGLGYTRLYWYPAGADGWQRAGHPTTPAEARPRTPLKEY